MRKQLSYEEVLMNLKQKGVQFSITRSPYGGKQENTSMMIGRYHPIIIPKKKS